MPSLQTALPPELPNNAIRVRVILVFYKNESFQLARRDVYDGVIRCPTPHRNFSVSGTRFSYGPATSDSILLLQLHRSVSVANVRRGLRQRCGASLVRRFPRGASPALELFGRVVPDAG
ncbi:hypothetical protein CASFOL_017211 [Castilleja foliolosa]|uniref:Uncharacterized protein n=1 Tax=Castilleja foliolosa TaxID=1961234 RepID=A0ABD3DDQ7_9LAMI